MSSDVVDPVDRAAVAAEMDHLVRVQVQAIEGCPGTDLAVQRVLEAAALVGVPVRLEQRTIDTLEEAVRLGFAGSPTVLVDGVDPFAAAPLVPALACRIYATPDGPGNTPTVQQLVDALLLLPR